MATRDIGGFLLCNVRLSLSTINLLPSLSFLIKSDASLPRPLAHSLYRRSQDQIGRGHRGDGRHMGDGVSACSLRHFTPLVIVPILIQIITILEFLLLGTEVCCFNLSFIEPVNRHDSPEGKKSFAQLKILCVELGKLKCQKSAILQWMGEV